MSEAKELYYNYVDCTLSKKDTAELIDLLLSSGCSVEDKHDYHATIIYDPRKEAIKAPVATFESGKEIKAHVIGFQLMGDGSPALLLNSREMYVEHMRLKEAGLQHSYPDFLPHLSIGYDVDQYEIEKLKIVLADYAGKELTFVNIGYGH